jgi:poly-gamma-glutamate capsule biosynthesis protein CapA/YwtB (metallophosphatase superfamily)
MKLPDAMCAQETVEVPRTVKLALAGDAMLGRTVAEAIRERGPDALVAEEVVAVANEADLFVLNLECCISERGEREPGKPFSFRAPPAATELLGQLRVDCVTLANNHALDYGAEALLDTLAYLHAAGIASVGAGADREQARAPATLEAHGFRLAVLGCADDPREWDAAPAAPGIAYGLDWVADAVERVEADAVLVTPHWGPNMATAPLPQIRRAAARLRAVGATLVAGHSAHVFHGVEGSILYDLGDFLDDYAVDPDLRNDLGLLFLVELDDEGPVRLEAVPLKLEFCHTRLAASEDAAWIGERFTDACRKLGTEVGEERGRLVVSLRV